VKCPGSVDFRRSMPRAFHDSEGSLIGIAEFADG
jgi:hypothetical protein